MGRHLDPSSIWVVPSAGGEPVELIDDEYLNVSPAWMPDGKHLLFVSNRGGNRDVYQIAIDKSGGPTSVAARVTTGLDAHTIDISRDGGSFAYAVFTHTANIWSLGIPNRGAVSISASQPVTTEAQVVEVADVSQDGKWLVFDSNREGNHDIHKMPVEGGEPQQLTTHPADDYAPTWSPDETEIAFYSLRNGNRDIYVMSTDGGAQRQITAVIAQACFDLQGKFTCGS